MSTGHTLTARAASVEVDACAGSSRGLASPDADAVPGRKRSTWDHCSPTTDTEFPYSDFHEKSRTWTEVP